MPQISQSRSDYYHHFVVKATFSNSYDLTKSKQVSCYAIVDTGASETSLHYKLLERLGLFYVNTSTSYTHNGVVKRDSYYARVALEPFNGLQNQEQPLVFPQVVIHEDTSSSIHQRMVFGNTKKKFAIKATIGMDIISRGCLIMSGETHLFKV